MAKKKNNFIYSKVIRWLWILFLVICISIPVYIYSVSINFLNLYGNLPSYAVLENPTSDLSTELYSADNVLLGKYYRHDRTPVSYDELSENLITALEVTEDIRFNEHSGIDLRGLVRVAIKTILLGQGAGGGSTLSQQLAKNLFGTRGTDFEGILTRPGIPRIIRMPFVKTKEWIVAVQLERAYTKEEILSMYLNTIEFGGNSYGIKVASKTFFNTEPDSLSIQQAAMLVGMLNAPTRFNPERNPKNALNKRTEILFNLYKYGMMTREEYDSIKVLDFGLDYKLTNHNTGPAYFKTVAGEWLRGWANDHGYDLYEDGLKIYTTINSKMQQYAETAVEEHMKVQQKDFSEHWKGQNPWRDEKGREIKGFLKSQARSKAPQYKAFVKKYGEDSDSVDIMMNMKTAMRVFSWRGEIDTLLSPMDSLDYYTRFLQTGFMAMDPHTGSIQAWVGGIDHKYFKYDHVKYGKRQPGSTFKPFVYTAAIELGFSPCHSVRDVPYTIELPKGQDPPTYTPANAGNKYTGKLMTLRQGMARSVNSITAFVMDQVSPEKVVNKAKAMGITSPLAPVPSLCLGVSDVSLFELIGAYSTFVNRGFWNEPKFITRIEDKNGNIIQEFPNKTIQSLSEETAYIMLHMLRGGTEEVGGTARGLSRELRYGNQIGAKTGTTNNASDGWFVGLTKDLVAGVWVGADVRSVHYKNWAMGAGGRVAMPIWEKFMLKVYADKELGYEKGPFRKPNRRLSVEIDCDRYNNLYSTMIDSLGVVDTVYHEHIEEDEIQ